MHGLEFTTAPILILIGLVLYFLPAANAYYRGHHNAGPILIINIFFGWTLLGWVIALAWSCSAIAPQRKKTTMPSVPRFVGLVCLITLGSFALLALGSLSTSTEAPSKLSATELRASHCRQEAGGMYGTITREAMQRFTTCLER